MPTRERPARHPAVPFPTRPRRVRQDAAHDHGAGPAADRRPDRRPRRAPRIAEQLGDRVVATIWTDRAAMNAGMGPSLAESTFHPDRLSDTTDQQFEAHELDLMLRFPGGPRRRSSACSAARSSRASSRRTSRRPGPGPWPTSRPSEDPPRSTWRPTRRTGSSRCRCGRTGRRSSGRPAATCAGRCRPRTRRGSSTWTSSTTRS